MAVKTFTTGEVLTTSDTNTYLANSGLVYITSTTVGSGVSSVTISNCFSSTYHAYRIVYTGYTGSVAEPIKMRLGAAATGYYGAFTYTDYGTGVVAGVPDSNQAYFRYVGSSSTAGSASVIEVLNPYLTTRTLVTAYPVQYSTAMGMYNGFLDNSTSYTDFTLYGFSTGTITGGTITVYGYRKA